MEVRLLGTGASDGWPNPWCTCASCEWARREGPQRTHTSALVDGVLLLDCGPDVPRAASRAGVGLGDVRWLLLGHGHPDHTGPAALQWRDWSTAADRPLEVLGPPAAIRACREFLGDRLADMAVELVEVRPDEELVRGPYRLRAWEADHGGPDLRPSLLWDVESTADGRRLLYGSDTLPLPEAALPTGPYDLVLLEETYGDGPPFGDHLGFDTFAEFVAGLRRSGAAPAGCRIVAVHLGHANPPGDELARRLAAHGAEVHPDGTLLDLGASSGTSTTGYPPSVATRPRRVLITGGTRSGKSEEAERRLRAEPSVVYAATALELPDDAEWTARLDLHRARRPASWTTVPTARLAPLLREPGPPVLVDDLVFWVTRGEESADELVAAFRAAARPTVVVTAEVGSGVVPASASGRRFRDELGRLNARMAAEADEVWHCVAGVACRLK